jgi:hypothetical protein
MAEDLIVGDNPNEPRPERPSTMAATETETGKRVGRKAKAVQEDITSGEEIESVTLEKDGRQFTIAKSIYDLEMAKPEKREDIKEGEPIYLRNPDLVGAKVVK